MRSLRHEDLIDVEPLPFKFKMTGDCGLPAKLSTHSPKDSHFRRQDDEELELIGKRW